jgi:hypothetical protein
MTPAEDAGYDMEEATFPDPATTSAPDATAFATAASTVEDCVASETLKLMISAPFATAQSMPSARSAAVQAPVAPHTFTGSRLMSHATPAMPSALSVRAPMTLATRTPAP